MSCNPNENRHTASTVKAFPREQDSQHSLGPGFNPSPLAPRTPNRTSAASCSGSSMRDEHPACYCGRVVNSESGIYCSGDCARTHTFTSLTHTRSGSLRSLAALAALQGCDAMQMSDDEDDDSDMSQYRRMAVRAEHLREERREERRRRRLTESISPVSRAASASLSPSGVPELVSSHSRNTSNASSIFSLSSGGSLSRNPSTSSRHVYAGSIVVTDPIIEADETVEPPASSRSTLKATKDSALNVDDMFDAILGMEQDFRVEDDDSPAPMAQPSRPSTPIRAAFVPTRGRPMRTPSPTRHRSSIPQAPSAPDRRERGDRHESLSHTRPSSTATFAHQSSLSESHTALYLATASPIAAPKSRHRRSASPSLHVRRSISFTTQAAGPALAPGPRRHDSPGLTPVRRKHLTPNAYHPAMDGWRFPTGNNRSSTGTTGTLTPTRPRFDSLPHGEPGSPIRPMMLWPRDDSSSSPRDSGWDHFEPPRSALRLGAFLGSSDMDVDSDDASTIRGSIRQSFAAPIPPFAQPGW